MKTAKKGFIFTVITVIILCCSVWMTSVSAAEETYTDGMYGYKIVDGKEAHIMAVLDWDMKGKNYELPSTLGGHPVTTVSAVFASGVGAVIPEGVEHFYFTEPYSYGETRATEMLRVTILNPNCKIEYYSSNLNHNRDAVVIGYKDSTAEAFAKEYNKVFIDIMQVKSQNGFSYLVENKEAKILWSDNGADGDLIIPDTLGGYPVTGISETAFARSSVNSVEMPDSVTEISTFAFGNCKSLSSVKFSNNLKTIGNSAFMICRNLKSLTLPDSLEKIGDRAFGECGFSHVNIPKNVKDIGILPFGCCDAKISVSEENEYFSTDENGVLFDRDKTTLIEYPYKSEMNEYTVPATVKSVRDYAFTASDGTSAVVLQDGVKAVGSFAFYYSRVSDVVIPGSVGEIRQAAFMNSQLERIEIGEGVESIGEMCFAGSDLKTIGLPISLVEIGKDAFDLTSIEHIAIPENVKSIGESAFSGMDNLKSMSVYSKNVSLDKVCDNDNGDKQLTLYGYRLSTAQKYASQQNYTFVPFFDGVDQILYEGNLIITASKEAEYLADGYLDYPWSQYADSTEVVLLDGVTDVGKGSFKNFSNVDIVIALGDNIHFYPDAFTNCDSLRTVITFGNSVFDENSFINRNGNITYYTQVGKSSNIPSVQFSYVEQDKSVTFNGDVTVSSEDFFNLSAAVCYGYRDKEIEKLIFNRFTAENFQFIYRKSAYETIRKNTIEEAVFTVEVGSSDDDMKQISFNELCEGIGNDEITKFRLVATDKDNANYDDNEVGVGEENLFVRWAKALLALLSKIFKLFERIRNG